jgi:hypothetical protein
MYDNNEISKKCKDYLKSGGVRTPLFYILPKIHKNKIPPPGRPIMSANDCPTEKISALVDHFLRPLVCKTKSYVKDTTHFLNLINEITNLPPQSLIVTLDVGSLYTNIPNKEGIDATKDFLNSQRDKEEVPYNSSLIELLELVLYKNNFEFNNSHYIQTGGTAMGTRVAPSFANLFMAYFEKKFVYCYKPGPLLWVRYIDDIFCIWTNGEQSLNNFFTHLNSCHPTIKFTFEYGTKNISFLDTSVSIQDGSLVTDLYTKPTDTHNYLSFGSCHPSHTKKALPYSQFLRVKRICTNTEDFIKNATTLKTHFTRRGYPKPLIDEAYERALLQDRNALLHPIKSSAKDNKTDDLFVITTFNPGLKTPRDIIKQNWPLLGTSNLTNQLFESKIVFGNRRCKNLKSQLVRARVPEPTPIRNKKHTIQNPCKTRNCKYCQKLDTSGRIMSTILQREYSSKIYVSCKSQNIIYCITCKKCQLQYVGQTKNRLIDRFGKHFYHIKKPDLSLPIGKHFNKPDHKGLEDIKIHIVDFIHAHPDSKSASKLRDQIEKNWILRLRTFAPFGLNTMDVKNY